MICYLIYPYVHIAVNLWRIILVALLVYFCRLTVMCEKPEIFFFNTRDMQHFRSSKDFPDMHALVMHTYNSNSDNANLLVDHLGLHKALCVLLGWNYSMPPDNSKTYQFLSADEAAANQDDLIMWPPTVIIHNTVSGKGKDGRMEGLGNKAMDNKLRGITCPFILYPHCCYLMLEWPSKIVGPLVRNPTHALNAPNFFFLPLFCKCIYTSQMQ